jgi:uncharacterized repeat protein (TIGR02543 family)
MNKIVSSAFALSTLFFVLCGIVQDSPLDEEGPNFEKPVIRIDTVSSSLKRNDTLHFDSATIILFGNRAESRFRVRVDDRPWSARDSAGAFPICSLSNGSHFLFIATMYEGGEKEFYDTLAFFVDLDKQRPLFPDAPDTVLLVDTGATVSFSVHADGSEPIGYQWFYGASAIEGKTDAIFAVLTFSRSDTGLYRCIATNRYGSDTSRIFRIQFIGVKCGVRGILVSGKTGERVPGATVTAIPGNVKVTSNSQGLFEINTLTPGVYSITISLTGYLDYVSAPFDVKDSTVTDLSFFSLIADETVKAYLKVLYMGNGNTGGSSPEDRNNYVAGMLVTVLGNSGKLVKNGYVFGGWNIAADGGGTGYLPGTTLLMGESDVVLFAKWKVPPTLTVTYDGNGNTQGAAPADTNKYAAGDSVVVLGNSGGLTKPSVSFAGWNTKADGTGTSYNAGSKLAMPSSSVTVYARWTTRPTSLVVYNRNGADSGGVPAPGTYVVNEVVTVSDNTGNLVKKGYVFSGWNTLPDGGGTTYGPGATVTKAAVNDTLYAKWDGYSYSVTFDDQGATTPATPASITVVSPATTVATLPAPPAKTGYVFGGWFTGVGGSGTEFTASTVVTGTRTVYAKWIGYSYTVTFNDQSATTPVSPKTKPVTSPATILGTLPTPPVKTGYVFGGWFTAVGGGGTEFTAITPVTSSITVYAKWTGYAYVIAFDDQGATTPVYPTSKTVYSPKTTVDTLPAAPKKTGYKFGGWYPAKNGGGTRFTAGTAVTESDTLYACWNSYSYNVVFYDQVGNTATKTVKSPATTVDLLPTPASRTGYTFNGWWFNAPPNGAWSPFTASTVVDTNLSVYATWTAINYTVTFNDQGATTPVNPATKIAAYGTSLGSLPAQPAKTGFAFSGWFTAVSGGGTSFTASTTVTANITVYAYWKVVDTVTFDDQGATTPVTPSTRTTVAGTSLGTLPAQPAKTGSVFSGWFTAVSGGGTQFTASTTVSASITVYAYWKAIDTVTFDDQGATTPVSPTTKTAIAGGNVGTLPTPPAKTGFTFGGWYTAISGGGTEFTASTPVSANITVYAKWTLAYSYTVTFDDESADTPPSPTTKTVVAPATTVGTLPANPVKSGEDFGGWFTARHGAGDPFTATTTVTGDITVYAYWTHTGP